MSRPDIPNISFILPVYKTEKYLKRCIENIRADTSITSQVIVVDDCSPGKCCSEIISQFHDIDYIRLNKNSGTFWARMVGIKKAIGKYICFIDPDDYYRETDFRNLYLEMEKTGADFGIYKICIDGRDKHFCSFETKEDPESIFHAFIHFEFKANLADKIFRTETVKELLNSYEFKNYHLTLAEDYCLCSCIAICSSKVIKLNCKTCYFYYPNKNSTTKKLDIPFEKISYYLDNYRIVREICLDFLKTKSIDQQKIREFDKRYSSNFNYFHECIAKHFLEKHAETSYEYFERVLNSFNNYDILAYFQKHKSSNFAAFINNKPQYKRTDLEKKTTKTSEGSLRDRFIGKIFNSLNFIKF